MKQARKKFPSARPVLITDNGPQFIAREFKAYLQIVGINHRRTRFYYPQSNGKIERFMQTCKNESVRRNSVIDLADFSTQIIDYIEHYNSNRLHSSLGYVAPFDMLMGRDEERFSRTAELNYNKLESNASYSTKNNALTYCLQKC